MGNATNEVLHCKLFTLYDIPLMQVALVDLLPACRKLTGRQTKVFNSYKIWYIKLQFKCMQHVTCDNHITMYAQ